MYFIQSVEEQTQHFYSPTVTNNTGESPDSFCTPFVYKRWIKQKLQNLLRKVYKWPADSYPVFDCQLYADDVVKYAPAKSPRQAAKILTRYLVDVSGFNTITLYWIKLQNRTHFNILNKVNEDKLRNRGGQLFQVLKNNLKFTT